MAPSNMIDDVADSARESDEQVRLTPPPPTPPPPSSVNSPAEIASNNKQARIREAEEDRVLIAQAQAGERIAFRKLVERHQRRAFAIAVGLVRDENDARELVQEAFLRVYKSLGSFQGTSSFFTWLYRIITNLSIDLIRKPGRQLTDAEHRQQGELDENSEADFPLVSRVDGADPMDVVERTQLAKRLDDALQSLPPYHRGVILMREVEGMSYDEMAESMGVSKGTIMSRLFHARQKLQRSLAACYEEHTGIHAVDLLAAQQPAPSHSVKTEHAKADQAATETQSSERGTS